MKAPPSPAPAFLECLALFPGGIQAFCHKGSRHENSTQEILRSWEGLPLSSPKSDDRHSALCTMGYNEIYPRWCSKQKGKTSHALKQQDSSTVWRELSEITAYGLVTLQMDKDPKWFGTLAKVTGTWWDSTPFCGAFSPCILPISHPSPARERLDFLLTRALIYVGWAQLAPSSLGPPSAPPASS